MAPYIFPTPLVEGVLLYKKARFVAYAWVAGKEERCFLPCTVNIGDFHLEQLPCLLQRNPPGRKTTWTVKALSVDEGRSWIGIDLNFSNKLFEHFAGEGELTPLLGSYTTLRREVTLGSSRLDFKVDDKWVELKTPVDTLHKLLGPTVRLRQDRVLEAARDEAEDLAAAAQGEASSLPANSEAIERRETLNPGRMEKQVQDMMSALRAGEQAALVTVHQYVPDTRRAYRRTTKKQTIRGTLEEAYALGLESWKLDLEFTPQGVSLHRLEPSRVKQ